MSPPRLSPEEREARDAIPRMTVRCKTEFGVARARLVVHRIAEVWAHVEGERLVYEALWTCTDSYVCKDAVLIADPKPFSNVCARCESLHLGCIVYRCYDARDALLYIGSTNDRRARLIRHAETTPWWPEVTRVETQDFPDLPSARKAEARAIEDESPLYNKLWNYRPWALPQSGEGAPPSTSAAGCQDGGKIRQFRKARRLSVRQLADQVKAHPQSLRNVELGRPASLDMLLKVAEALDVGLNDIVRRDIA